MPAVVTQACSQGTSVSGGCQRRLPMCFVKFSKVKRTPLSAVYSHTGESAHRLLWGVGLAGLVGLDGGDLERKGAALHHEEELARLPLHRPPSAPQMPA